MYVLDENYTYMCTESKRKLLIGVNSANIVLKANSFWCFPVLLTQSNGFYYHAIMEVLHLGNPVLREKSEPVAAVTQEIVQLVSDMFETMDMQRGVGLAAPQVGKLLRMFVITIDDGVRRVFINPQIIETSVETCEIEEGCLSIPDVWESITRPSRVTVQALDEHGRPFTIEADGYLARVIQHEYDHLDGVLYIDRGDAEFRDKTIAKFERRAERRRQKDAIKAAKAARIEAKKAAKAASRC